MGLHLTAKQLTPLTALDALQALTIDEPTDVFITPEQLEDDLLTLTLLPRSRWQTLLNLDVIQVYKHYFGPLLYSYLSSNETSRRSHQKLQKRLLSFFPLCLA
jgi:hypothetical protein